VDAYPCGFGYAGGQGPLEGHSVRKFQSSLIATAIFVTGAALRPATAGEAVLHRFGLLPWPSQSQAPLIQDNAGTLYGSSFGGGTSGNGTVFALTRSASGKPTATVLYSFGQSSTDGLHPQDAMTLDANGNIFGTTTEGGKSGNGTVFELVRPAGGTGAWEEKILHSFNGADGNSPHGHVVLGDDGAVYGTAAFGGKSYAGVAFRLAQDANGVWQEQALHEFTGGADGDLVLSSLSRDAAGNLYGTALAGGSAGFGVVFRLSPDKDGVKWHETVLYDFVAPGDGHGPQTGVIVGPDGVLYGSTTSGGTLSYGTVFSLTPPHGSGDGWTETVLHNFDYTVDGMPGVELPVLDGHGNLLGTSAGGTAHLGAVWKLTKPAQAGGAWSFSFLHSFTGAPDGAAPASGLLEIRPGVFVGTTELGGSKAGQNKAGNGVVYEIVR
jgi:uncharacterized repeat protein (TIGR03803 family)